MNVEQMLRGAAAEVDWPAAPDLAAAVVPRISGVAPLQTGDRRAAARSRIRIGRPLAIALAALLLLAATAAAVPGIRNPVLDWLGLRSVRVERVPAPLPALGKGLGLGTQTTLDTARAKLGFRPVLLSGSGSPAVYYEPFPAGGQIGLAYPRGIVVTEVQGRLETRFLAKFLPPGTTADALTIDGGRALWIHGAPHQYAYLDRQGNIHTDSVRTAGDVLLWHRDDLLIRLEGARSRQQAVALAASAREVP